MKPFALRSHPGVFLAALAALGLPLLEVRAEEAAPATPAAAVPATDTPEKAQETPAPEAAAPKEAEAAEAAPAEVPLEAAPGEFRSWFDVSIGGLMVNGDRAAAQQRFQRSAAAFGGVEEFHLEKDVGKRGLFKIEGRGIFDEEDYGLRLELSEPDKGFLRGGFSRYRQYSDGSGGYFPAGPGGVPWFDLFDDELEVTRSSAFFEAGLRLPKIPEITVRYRHDERDGTKASTIWADSGLTGGYGVRAYLPSFYRIDESSDLVSIDLKHTLGNTTFGGGFIFQQDSLDNARQLLRRPGESSERYVTQSEKVERDTYTARAFVDTVFNERIRFTTSYLHTSLDTDLGGSRIVGAGYDPVYDPVFARRDVGFLNLSGGSELAQDVWNANALWTPFPTLALIPALRIENQSVDGSSSWLDTGAEDIARGAANSRDMLDLSQQLELRYTGITNVVLYTRGDWTQGDGNLLESQALRTTGLVELNRDSDFDRFSQKYTAGAHWYPLRRLNLHAQYYRKMRDDDYEVDGASYVNLSGVYPGYLRSHGFDTDDVNLRVTWRPLDKLTLVSRYDFQLSTIEMQAAGLAEQDSGRNESHIFSETITWTPIPRLWVQPGLNYVISATESDASGAGPVQDADNDYMTVSCSVGVVVDDRTDLQARYSYYLADNFDSGFTASVPYGAGLEEHGIFASLIRRINPRLRVTLSYGFYTSRSDMSGGYDDYDAHLLSTSARYLF